MDNLFVYGNATMPKSVAIFNLPPLKTCTPSPWCRENCYGLKRRFTWHSVKKSLAWRYEESKKADFINKATNEIKKFRVPFVRIHITGDFYNKEYIDKWATIARACPGIIFRTNTKRQDFLPYMIKIFPENIVLRESIDESRNELGLTPVAAIVGTPRTSQFFICCNNCEPCGFYCWKNPEINIVGAKIL